MQVNMLASMEVLLGFLVVAISAATLWWTIRRGRPSTKTKLRARPTVRLDRSDAVFAVTVVNLGERSDFVDKPIVEGGNPWDEHSPWFYVRPDVGKPLAPRVVQEVRIPLSNTDPVFETFDPVLDAHRVMLTATVCFSASVTFGTAASSNRVGLTSSHQGRRACSATASTSKDRTAITGSWIV
jgi:hypothetical protein